MPKTDVATRITEQFYEVCGHKLTWTGMSSLKSRHACIIPPDDVNTAADEAKLKNSWHHKKLTAGITALNSRQIFHISVC
jgi:hypothetical protein